MVSPRINPALKLLINSHIFERIIFLEDKNLKGEVKKVYFLNKLNSEYIKE